MCWHSHRNQPYRHDRHPAAGKCQRAHTPSPTPLGLKDAIIPHKRCKCCLMLSAGLKAEAVVADTGLGQLPQRATVPLHTMYTQCRQADSSQNTSCIQYLPCTNSMSGHAACVRAQPKRRQMTKPSTARVRHLPAATPHCGGKSTAAKHTTDRDGKPSLHTRQPSP